MNTGDHLDKKELNKRLLLNKKKYGLPPVQIRSITIPKTSQTTYDCLDFEKIYSAHNNFSLIEKIHHLERLKECATKHLGYLLREKKKLIINVEKVEDPVTKQESYRIVA